MEAIELRIGNFLYYKNTNELAIVELIHKKHYDCRDEYGTFTPNSRYKPIPLSKEWLLNFGFVENCLDEDNKWLNLKYRFLNFSSDESVRFKKVYLSINKMDIICDYVHQLQNVFFSLTGQELIKKNQEK